MLIRNRQQCFIYLMDIFLDIRKRIASALQQQGFTDRTDYLLLGRIANTPHIFHRSYSVGRTCTFTEDIYFTDWSYYGDPYKCEVSLQYATADETLMAGFNISLCKYVEQNLLMESGLYFQYLIAKG